MSSDRPAVYTPFLRRFTDEKARDLSETIQLYNQVRAAHHASRWSSPDIREKVFIEIAEFIEDSVGLPDNTELNRALGRCILEMIDLETTVFSFPEIEWPVANLSMKEQLNLRRFLRAKEHFLNNQDRVWETLKQSIATVAVGFIKQLPPLGADEAMSIPLFSKIHDVGDIVDRLIGTINTEEHQTLGLFTALQQTFYENVCEASGIAPDADSKKRPITADKSTLPSEKLVEIYLQNTPFFKVFQTPIPFAVPDHIRFSGHWIIAPPGRGKTTLLLSMLMEDFKKDATVIVMDSKGDLIEPIRNLKSLENRYIIIDPSLEGAAAINPLDIPKTDASLALDNLEYVFSSLLESKLTANQRTLFRSVLRALITTFPNPTLETFRDVLTNGIKIYDEHIKKLPQDLQDFFYKEFHSKLYEDRKPEVLMRLRLLLENDIIKVMLLAERTKFDMAKAMDSGKVIIINNSKALLGEQGAEFFGRLFIAQVLSAAQARSGRRQEDKKPVYFYIDECHNVISRDERIPTILDECRSQKVALILAHQRTNQITLPNVSSALANCGIRYANSDDEAKALAPSLRTSTAFLQSLRTGQFAAFVRDMTRQAVAINVTPVDFSQVPKLSRVEEQALAARMAHLYGVDKPSISERAMQTVRSPEVKPAAMPKPKSPPKDEDPEFGSTY